MAEPGQHIAVSWRLSAAGSWSPQGPDFRHGNQGQGGPIQGQGHAPVHHRKTGSCTVTIVFIDGGLQPPADHQPGRVGRQPEASTAARNTVPPSSVGGSSATSGRANDVTESPIHVTTCSTGSREEPRMIYASRHSRLQIRPTDAMLARLGTSASAADVDGVNWKPHLLEYHSEFGLG